MSEYLATLLLSSSLSEIGLGVLTCSRMLRRVAPGGMALAGTTSGSGSLSDGRKGGRGAENERFQCQKNSNFGKHVSLENSKSKKLKIRRTTNLGN